MMEKLFKIQNLIKQQSIASCFLIQTTNSKLSVNTHFISEFTLNYFMSYDLQALLY